MILRALSSLWTSYALEIANHLWQSTLFVALAAILTFALRQNQARIRHAIWLAASIKFLLPFSLLIALGSHFAKPQVSTHTQAVVYSAVENLSQPFAPQDIPVIYHPTPAATSASLLHLLPAIAVALWLVGIVVVLLRWAAGWVRISLMVRKAAPVTEGPEIETLRTLESSLGVRTPIRLVLSQDWMEPGIFGIFRPVLIWPAGISGHLDDSHIQTILAHEVCHAQRGDNLTAALHMLVEAIFWFHPLVWWMEAKLEQERERACDEQVSLLCNQPHVYAESILKVCKFCSESPLACVSGITGADLKKRIMQIMTDRVVRKLNLGRKLLLLSAGLAVVAVPMVLAQAKAAQRMMLAVAKAAPTPFRLATRAMVPLEETHLTAFIAEAQPTQTAPANGTATDGMELGPEFEVASIRPANPNEKNGGNWVSSSGRFEGHNTTLRGLVGFAYTSFPHSSGDSVSAGPGWFASDHFDVEAKIDAGQMANWTRMSDYQRIAMVKPMLRRLLVERFHLQLHTETQVKDVFVLVQSKGGSKLKEVTPPPPINDDEALQQDAKESMAQKSPKPIAGAFMMSQDGWSGNSIPIGTLLNEISVNAHLGAPLIDQTGLTGYYDFTMKVSYDKDAPLLIDQVDTLLGLKVEPRKLPLKVYVIDSAEKPSVDGSEVPATTGAATVTPLNPNINAPTPSFEVATVKPADPNARFSSLNLGTDDIKSTNLPIAFLLQFAYGLNGGSKDQIIGAPAWISTARFDINAKMDEATAATIQKTAPDQRMATLKSMVGSLLSSRFSLAIHHETQTLPVLALSISQGGPKLVSSSTHPTPNGEWTGLHNPGPGQMEGRDITISELASALSNKPEIDGRLVVDHTGLPGKYNFTFNWAPENSKTQDSGGPSLFTALKEQLGLQLDLKKLPVDCIVIDHADRIPTDN